MTLNNGIEHKLVVSDQFFFGKVGSDGRPKKASWWIAHPKFSHVALISSKSQGKRQFLIKISKTRCQSLEIDGIVQFWGRSSGWTIGCSLHCRSYRKGRRVLPERTACHKFETPQKPRTAPNYWFFQDTHHLLNERLRNRRKTVQHQKIICLCHYSGARGRLENVSR